MGKKSENITKELQKDITLQIKKSKKHHAYDGVKGIARKQKATFLKHSEKKAIIPKEQSESIDAMPMKNRKNFSEMKNSAAFGNNSSEKKNNLLSSIQKNVDKSNYSSSDHPKLEIDFPRGKRSFKRKYSDESASVSNKKDAAVNIFDRIGMENQEKKTNEKKSKRIKFLNLTSEKKENKTSAVSSAKKRKKGKKKQKHFQQVPDQYSLDEARFGLESMLTKQKENKGKITYNSDKLNLGFKQQKIPKQSMEASKFKKIEYTKKFADKTAIHKKKMKKLKTLETSGLMNSGQARPFSKGTVVITDNIRKQKTFDNPTEQSKFQEIKPVKCLKSESSVSKKAMKKQKVSQKLLKDPNHSTTQGNNTSGILKPNSKDLEPCAEAPKVFRGFEGREETEERQSRTLFVGNIPLGIDHKNLEKIFSKHGKVESARIRSSIPSKISLSKKLANITHKYHSDIHSLKGYVVMKSLEDANNAVKLNGTLIQNHHIRVDFAFGTQKYDDERSIFIGNLPFDVEEESMWSTFSEYGHIESVRVIRDKYTGEGKGFGYILFKKAESVDKAISMDAIEIEGRQVRVKPVEYGKKNPEKSQNNFKPRFNSFKCRAFKQKKMIKNISSRKSIKKLVKKSKVAQKKKKIASMFQNKK